jgi:hypothetical protein
MGRGSRMADVVPDEQWLSGTRLRLSKPCRGPPTTETLPDAQDGSISSQAGRMHRPR